MADESHRLLLWVAFVVLGGFHDFTTAVVSRWSGLGRGVWKRLNRGGLKTLPPETMPVVWQL